MRQKRKIKQNRSPQKARDIAIGFLGWAILDNIYLSAGLSLGYFISLAQSAGFFVALIIPFLIIVLILLWKKQTWFLIGIGIAVLVNAGVWALLFGTHLGQWYYYLFCPFPAGKNLLV